MTTTNDLDSLDNLEVLNSDIRQALIEVWPVVSPELQLEITFLLEQVHQINNLIHQRNDSWITHWFKLNNKPTKFTLLLQEIKDILLALKSNQISSGASHIGMSINTYKALWTEKGKNRWER